MVVVLWATIHEASPMAQKISVLGIDIAKLVFHVVGMDDTGHVVLRKRVARGDLLHFIATLPPVLIGMEACGSAHHWARRFREHGHDVRLIAPQFVKAYVKSPKNDARDAEAICEAVTRPTMRFSGDTVFGRHDVGVPLHGKASVRWPARKEVGARRRPALGSGRTAPSTPDPAAGAGGLCASAAWHGPPRRGSGRLARRRTLAHTVTVGATSEHDQPGDHQLTRLNRSVSGGYG